MDTILDRRFATFRFAYEIHELVYLKTDPHQRPRMVVAYRITAGSLIEYELSSGATEITLHNEAEIQREPDFSRFFFDDEDDD